jgi:hypothetical protein
VIEVSPFDNTVAGAPPNVTDSAPDRNFPLIVTVVPPETPVTTGVGKTWIKWLPPRASWAAAATKIALRSVVAPAPLGMQK